MPNHHVAERLTTALKDSQLIMVRQRVMIQKREEGCLASIAWAHRFEIRFENASEVQCGRIVAHTASVPAEAVQSERHSNCYLFLPGNSLGGPGMVFPISPLDSRPLRCGLHAPTDWFGL
jgi:hypothetical protein